MAALSLPSHPPRCTNVALVTTPVMAFHLAVHGFAANGYIASSSQVGFTLQDLGWKAYVLLLEPQPWFADGQGLLQRMPWVAVGLTGLVAAFMRGQKDRMLATVLLVHGVLYTSYVDLLPPGLWRFLHVHYFAWAVPGYGLVAALLIRDLARPGWPRRIAGASAVAAAVVFGLRVVPAPAAAEQPAKAVDFAGPYRPLPTHTLTGPWHCKTPAACSGTWWTSGFSFIPPASACWRCGAAWSAPWSGYRAGHHKGMRAPSPRRAGRWQPALPGRRAGFGRRRSRPSGYHPSRFMARVHERR